MNTLIIGTGVVFGGLAMLFGTFAAAAFLLMVGLSGVAWGLL